MLGGLFCGTDGKTVSSRRVIAFLYAITGIVSGDRFTDRVPFQNCDIG